MLFQVEIIVRAVKEVHEFWANAIQIVIATWLLSIQLGYAASGPIIVSLVALLGTGFTSPFAMKYQIAWLGETQKRVGKAISLSLPMCKNTDQLGRNYIRHGWPCEKHQNVWFSPDTLQHHLCSSQ